MLTSPTPSNDVVLNDDMPFPINENNISNVEFVKEFLVTNKRSANSKCPDGTPLLALAIKHEAFETTKFLLEHRGDIKATDAQNIQCLTWLKGTSPEFSAACLEFALEKEIWLIIAELLGTDIPIHEIYWERMSLKPIMATEQNEMSQTDKVKSSLFYSAIKKQLPNVVRFLLEHNVTPNVTSFQLGSPLDLAIRRLAYPTNAVWVQKEKPTYQANNPAMYEIIELLLKHKAISSGEIKVPNTNETFNPLTFSVYNHDIKLFDLLLAYNQPLEGVPPMEAITKLLCEQDASNRTPLGRSIGVKSRKMYDYLLKKCPDLLIKDSGAFSDFFNHVSDPSRFMNEVLSSIPLSQKKILFQPYSSDKGETGDRLVNNAMRKNSLPLASTLLKHGANLPTITNARGKVRFNQAVNRKLKLPNWQSYFEEYCKELKAAEVTPSVLELAANVIYDHTHHSEFATEQLQGYLPPELFQLYRSTPQRRDSRDAHFKPHIRKCLESALPLNEESIDECAGKKVKRNP